MKRSQMVSKIKAFLNIKFLPVGLVYNKYYVDHINQVSGDLLSMLEANGMLPPENKNLNQQALCAGEGNGWENED